MGLKRAVAQARPEEERRSRTRTAEDLLAGLLDPDPEVRRWCALDLAAVPGSAEALVAALAVETEAPVRDALLTSLARYDDEGCARALLPLIDHDEPAVRNAGVVALQVMPVGMAAVVAELLACADSDRRILTVLVLSRLVHPQAGAWLAQVVQEDPHENVVAAAADALLGRDDLDDEVAGSLIDLLEQARGRFPQNPYLSFLASRGLRDGPR